MITSMIIVYLDGGHDGGPEGHGPKGGGQRALHRTQNWVRGPPLVVPAIHPPQHSVSQHSVSIIIIIIIVDASTYLFVPGVVTDRDQTHSPSCDLRDAIALIAHT
jgi:hypothetical protein